LPPIPAARYKKLIDLISKDGANITELLTQARGAFTFTPEQEKEFNAIITEAATKKQAA